MSFAPFGNFSVDPLFEILEILNVDQIYMLEVAKFTFRDKFNLLPTNLAKFFETSPSNRRVSQRNAQPATNYISYNTCAGAKSIQSKSIDIWNKVPDELKVVPWINSFKRFYKSHLLLLNFN